MSDPYVTTCIDACNGFNELNCKAMLWTVRHLWPSGSRFVFNCYRHHSLLILRRKNGSSYTLQSREGCTQGDPLSMVIYGLTPVPLSKFLREQTPTVIQPFYADDLSFSGDASDIAQAMRLLQHHGPSRGYFPEPTKSIVLCTESEEFQAKQFLDEFQFIYKRCSCYIGGLIGATTCLTKWVNDQVESWVRSIKLLSRAAKRFPQTSFAALTRSLQTEWTYLQRVVPDVAPSFAPIEEAPADSFLPALFGGKAPPGT